MLKVIGSGDFYIVVTLIGKTVAWFLDEGLAKNFCDMMNRQCPV